MKQISTRLTVEEYRAFENWRQSQDVPESQALIDLIKRYFDGGYRRSPKYRLQQIHRELDQLCN